LGFHINDTNTKVQHTYTHSTLINKCKGKEPIMIKKQNTGEINLDDR